MFFFPEKKNDNQQTYGLKKKKGNKFRRFSHVATTGSTGTNAHTRRNGIAVFFLEHGGGVALPCVSFAWVFFSQVQGLTRPLETGQLKPSTFISVGTISAALWRIAAPGQKKKMASSKWKVGVAVGVAMEHRQVANRAQRVLFFPLFPMDRCLRSVQPGDTIDVKPNQKKKPIEAGGKRGGALGGKANPSVKRKKQSRSGPIKKERVRKAHEDARELGWCCFFFFNYYFAVWTGSMYLWPTFSAGPDRNGLGVFEKRVSQPCESRGAPPRSDSAQCGPPFLRCGPLPRPRVALRAGRLSSTISRVHRSDINQQIVVKVVVVVVAMVVTLCLARDGRMNE